MGFIIGVDVGGTQIRAARFDHNLTLIERAQQPTLAGQGSDAVLSRLYETVRQVLPESPEDLDGIGLAVPGPIDPYSGVLIAPPNLPFRDVPVQQMLQDAVGGPVFIGNDADLAGLGEYRLGAGQGTTTMVYMTISTGIGGGLIINGNLFVGHGQAGEIGHMIVDPQGPLCNCGKPGHLEALASGTAIARIVRQRISSGEASSVADIVGDELEQISAREVGQAATEGDPLCLEVITGAGRYIGMGIASLMMTLNPDIFVLGGGVTNIGSMLFDPIDDAVREYCMHARFWEDTPIVRASLGGDVGLVGAAALVQMRQG